jgi:hypothetical protein
LKRSTTLRLFAAAAMVAMGMVTIPLTSTAGAAKSGNSANAKLCQKDGWQDWVRADQTAFANEEDCVSYAALGGTLTVPCRLDPNGGGCVPT